MRHTPSLKIGALVMGALTLLSLAGCIQDPLKSGYEEMVRSTPAVADYWTLEEFREISADACNVVKASDNPAGAIMGLAFSMLGDGRPMELAGGVMLEGIKAGCPDQLDRFKSP